MLVFYDWSLAAENMPQIYILELAKTGETTIRLPMENFQLRLRNDTPTYFQCTVPNAPAYADQIAARSTGTLTLYAGARLNGQELLQEVVAVVVESISDQRGGNSQSITLNGHVTVTVTDQWAGLLATAIEEAGDDGLGAVEYNRFANMAPRTRTLQGITYRASESGKKRYRGRFDRFLRAGDIAQIPAYSESISVGTITHTVGPTSAFTEIAEADG
jgi:hypothetical protein